MAKTVAFAAVLSVLSCAVSAGPVACEGSYVTVTSGDAKSAGAVCDAAKKADALFARCNVPAFSRPVPVKIVEDLKDGCVAIYHCDDDYIELLSPTLMQKKREPDGAFADLGAEAYFRSVVIHELTHAANSDIPCPFDACVAADEYVAYAMQILSLAPQDRRAFETRSGLERPISSDELSPIILFMAPDLFAQKTWAHLSQREDACAYIGQLVSGTTLLDRGRF